MKDEPLLMPSVVAYVRPNRSRDKKTARLVSVKDSEQSIDVHPADVPLLVEWLRANFADYIAVRDLYIKTRDIPPSNKPISAKRAAAKKILAG